MNLPLDFHPAVRDEIDGAYDWYENRQPKLGRGFLDEVEQVLSAMTANPAHYGYADGDIREGLLRRFPYAVYYRVLADRIRVLAVYHASRNPSGWQARA